MSMGQAKRRSTEGSSWRGNFGCQAEEFGLYPESQWKALKTEDALWENKTPSQPGIGCHEIRATWRLYEAEAT